MVIEVPGYPLPYGHVFGPQRNSIIHHDGTNPHDSLALRQWQTRLRNNWRQNYVEVTGRFDAATQRAVLRVQEVLGVPRTGVLGAREWEAAWTHELPTKPKPPKPPTGRGRSKQPGYRQDYERRRKYWEDFSQWKVELGKVLDAPPWYPGRPFSVHSRGPYVEHVQRLLGFPPHGRFTVRLMQRIRGLQRVHDLPETGVVDAGTAKLLERLYGSLEPDLND